jgi:cytochrome c
VSRLAYLIAALTGAMAAAGAAQAADPAAGAKTFATFCVACHSADAPPVNRIGPSLHGVVGRKAGAITGFRYSKAMTSSGKTWTPAALDAYLTDPRKVVPGTSMTFRGLADPTVRANLIAYLSAHR